MAQDDIQVVNYVNGVFGVNTTVYYEWANEPDLEGPDATTYTNAWNAVVPQLKTRAPAAKFIGPVSFQYDPTYLQTFLKGANPAPDAVSWHEYTCSDSQTEAYCLAHISNWLNHLAAGRSLMQQTIGRVLPVWITEWNYTPVINSSDPKHNDSAFLQQWTTTALQTLAKGGVEASMHYDVQNLLPLVNTDGSLAAEGMSFKSSFSTLVG